jgi:hypothetical protein
VTDPSPAALIAELRDNARALADAIDTARTEATRQGIDPRQALSTDGAPLLGPLVAARGQVLAALALLAAASTE